MQLFPIWGNVKEQQFCGFEYIIDACTDTTKIEYKTDWNFISIHSYSWGSIRLVGTKNINVMNCCVVTIWSLFYDNSPDQIIRH